MLKYYRFYYLYDNTYSNNKNLLLHHVSSRGPVEVA